jgi:hypothetical protein
MDPERWRLGLPAMPLARGERGARGRRARSAARRAMLVALEGHDDAAALGGAARD